MEIYIVSSSEKAVVVFFATQNLAKDFLNEMEKLNSHLTWAFSIKKVFDYPLPPWKEE